MRPPKRLRCVCVWSVYTRIMVILSNFSPRSNIITLLLLLILFRLDRKYDDDDVLMNG